MSWICNIFRRFINLFRRKKKLKTVFKHLNNINEWNTFERELLLELNLYRSENNLQILIADKFCKQQTDLRTSYCIYKGYVTHHQMGVVVENSKKVGLKNYRENLAYKYKTAQGTLQAWIKSEAHNKTLLHKESIFVGISMDFDSSGDTFVTLGLFY